MSGNLREIPVELLVFGMYVSKLDRPWTETPFMFQGFVLNSEKQLNALKKYCKKVYVDPEKEDRSVAPRAAGGAPAAAVSTHDAAIRAQLKESIRGTTVYRQVATVEEELPKAAAAVDRSKQIVRTMVSTVRTGAVLDGPRTTRAVKEITASVERNPDAMMLLAKMRERSRETLDRSIEVSVYLTAFGRYLQLPQNQLELLGMVGLLQDVGLLKLPPGLAERRHALAGKEEEVFRTHVEHSVEILSKTPGLPPELPGIASLHHERYDGSGYPRGLRGSAIALLGQMAGIVDTFDMLTSPKPYGAHLSPSAALNVLYKERGTRFHAGAVEQFIQCLGAFPVGSVVELNTGEIGVVIAQNMVRRLQPRVMVVQDAKGNPVLPHKIIDLMREPMATADEPYRIRQTLESDRIRIDPKTIFL